MPALFFIAILLALATAPLTKHFLASTPLVYAAGTDLGALSGYAWSDNLGWISFSGGTYQVVVQSDGTLAGYAWANPSDDTAGTNNIGWISFNAADTASCGLAAKLTGTSITGWAKVLSANNGWDGCISLNGGTPAYGVTLNSSGSSQSGTLGGYAWSDSTVGGWISFNCATGGPTANNICATSNYAVVYTTGTPPPPSITINQFTSSPLRVRSGNTSTLLYNVTSGTACTIANSANSTTYPVTADSVQHSITTFAITANTLFTLSCGSSSRTTSVGILPVYKEL